MGSNHAEERPPHSPPLPIHYLGYLLIPRTYCSRKNLFVFVKILTSGKNKFCSSLISFYFRVKLFSMYGKQTTLLFPSLPDLYLMSYHSAYLSLNFKEVRCNQVLASGKVIFLLDEDNVNVFSCSNKSSPL